MGDQFDILFTISQIAVAFAGFGAVATAFSARREGGDIRVDAGRLTTMVTTSLAATFSGITPAVIAQYGVDERWVWTASSVFALLVGLICFPIVLVRMRNMGRYGKLNGPALLAGFVFAFGWMASWTLAILDIPAGLGAATYITGAGFLLGNTAILFFLVVYSILRPYSPDMSDKAPSAEPPAA